MRRQLAFSFAVINSDHMTVQRDSFSHSHWEEQNARKKGLFIPSFRQDLKDLFILLMSWGRGLSEGLISTLIAQLVMESKVLNRCSAIPPHSECTCTLLKKGRSSSKLE